MRGVERVVRVVPPFVGACWRAGLVVLVEREEKLVLQDGEVFGCELVELGKLGTCILRYVTDLTGRGITYGCSDQEGRLHGCPEGKVGSLLLDRELAVAHFQHVWVVAAVKVDAVKPEGVQVEDLSNARPVGWRVTAC